MARLVPLPCKRFRLAGLTMAPAATLVIPVFGSEIEQVKVGCAASASIDYVTVGKSAGTAAAAILGGKSAADIPVATITDPANYYNSEVCRTLGLTVPDGLTLTDVKN